MSDTAVSSTPRRPRVSATPPASGPRPGPSGRALAVAGCGGLAALIALAGLVGAQRVEALADPWHPTRLLVYALLIGGPAALLWAVSRALGLGWFWLPGAASWAALGAVLIFVPPPARATAQPGDYALLLVPLFLALVAAAFPPLAWLAGLLAPSRPGGLSHRAYSRSRPLRQAALVALFVVGSLLMLTLGVLNWLNLLLWFAVLALAEVFFVART